MSDTLHSPITNSRRGVIHSWSRTLIPTTKDAPGDSESPSHKLLARGGIAQFSINASSTPRPTYQWRKDSVSLVNGGPIAGANSPTLIIAADLFDVGVYDCVVTNTAGQATSNPAVLAVRGCLGDADGNGAVLASFNLMFP